MKKHLFTGLLVWVPLLITAWVVLTVVGLVDKVLLLLPDAWQPEALFGFYVPGLGLVLTALVLVLTGVLSANFFGAWLLRTGDAVLSRIPLLKVIYTSVKQISDSLLSSSGKAFQEAVLVPYPTRMSGPWGLSRVPRLWTWPGSTTNLLCPCTYPLRPARPRVMSSSCRNNPCVHPA